MCAVLSVGSLPLVAGIPAEDEGERSFRVSGYGLFGNRALSRIAPLLEVGEDEVDPYYAPELLENILLLVHSRVERDGYRDPSYRLEMVSPSGKELSLDWDGRSWLELPMGWRAQQVRLHIDRGVYHYYRSIEFIGLPHISADDAQAFFFPGGFILQLNRYRPFSMAGLNSGKNNLLDELRQYGYRDLRAADPVVTVDSESGAVDVELRIEAGPRYWVSEVEVVSSEEAEGLDLPLGVREIESTVFSAQWQREKVREVLNAYYQAGFPDASSRAELVTLDRSDTRVDNRLRIHIQPGPRVRVGSIDFVGEGRTIDSVLHRRVGFESGDWLNPLELDEARFRLGRLGIFDRTFVETEAEEPDSEESAEEDASEGDADEYRSVRFGFIEGQRLEFSLLMGYSTYEKIRGGFEVDRRNLWGRAHRDRLRVVQSFKASSARYTYSMPEFFGEDLTASIEGSFLRREELSFRRSEWGSEFRLTKLFSGRSQASLAYRLESLQSSRFEFVDDIEGRTRSRVASLNLAVSRDTRDNPLYPSRGNQSRAELEIGSQYLGADVNYQRLHFLHSRHWTLRDGLRVHARLSHGIAATLNASNDNLPVNRRFYPGGVHSIRGYRPGAASPVDSSGQYIGAEVYVLAQAEIEQDISPGLAGVVFYDALWTGRSLGDYPGDLHLNTVGLGLRYRTLVGPVRIEGGWNLDRREIDPAFTLQLSLGFPF
ncbi:MAG: BamA/TamA family outer membrane protein [Opitutales bacterium]|nr:BamA/TamA family outer membrane protein [Opitutales bacterium]